MARCDLLPHDEMRTTKQNRQAGAYLEVVRGDTPQIEFARGLSERLGVTVTQSALSKYERARVKVPADVVIAASEMTGEPIAVNETTAKAYADRLADRAWRELTVRAKALGWPTEPQP